ncbi:DUF202 domain-containing protein [Fulvivirga sp.]|uniref:DUF202 domain-containing protein n=1 Tax=Fulvivirga sp. TaxID=1931237 RepID=UPI0032F092C3
MKRSGSIMNRIRKVKLPVRVRKFENKEKIILRDFLALERTTLANERTLFAYIRTSLYITLAGFAFMELEQLANLSWISFVLFGIAVSLIATGLIRYAILRNKLMNLYEDDRKGAKMDKRRE